MTAKDFKMGKYGVSSNTRAPTTFRPMRIAFHGAAGFVTGSCHLLTLDDGFRILFDCGLYQGYDKGLEDFNQTFNFDPASIDVMVLSHAHIDHCGRLPKLVKEGFKGKIYCTHATRSLAGILLLDSAHIQEKDAEYYNKRQTRRRGAGKFTPREPLYTKKDVQLAMRQFVALPYDTRMFLHDSATLEFRDAGHILGSATVNLRIDGRGTEEVRFGFTGDVGRPERPILRDPVQMPEHDFLLTESTYGDRDHVDLPAEKGRFLDIIKDTCERRGGKLIIPAFSVGRTQEIVYLLDQLENEGKLSKRIPVYVDSPLAINATTIYGNHPECYDSDLHEYLLTDPNPFGFNTLTYTRKVEDSKAINSSKGPAIIIASSGMANAGRIKHHLANNLADPKNTAFIVGYCAPGTPGARLRNGEETVKLFGEEVPVNAKVEVMDSFSAHADRQELVRFLDNQKGAKRTFLVHGDDDARAAFGDQLQAAGHSKVTSPKLYEEVELK